jgi:hypothetical protein
LSKLSTGSSLCASQSNTKFEPINPAPPVTKIIFLPYRNVKKNGKTGHFIDKSPAKPKNLLIGCMPSQSYSPHSPNPAIYVKLPHPQIFEQPCPPTPSATSKAAPTS